MNRTRIGAIITVTLAALSPEAALADWKVYFTGEAARMYGSAGRGSYATRAQCEEARRTLLDQFSQANSYCAGFDAPSAAPPTKPTALEDSAAAARFRVRAQMAEQRRQQAQRDSELARQRRTEAARADSVRLRRSADSAAQARAGGRPGRVAASDAWTPAQCQVAQRRVDVYRAALQQTVAVADRFNRAMAADMALRAQWEMDMTAAIDRATNRAQFLWLALPLGKLSRLDSIALAGLDKNGQDLAALLAGTRDAGTRTNIRVARQFVAEEREVVTKLDASYANIDHALTLGGNAPLMLEDPDESPTSPFRGDGMKLREALDMLNGLLVERANAPWLKYLTGGLSTAFATEAAARAMFDSWYDAYDASLAWKQIHTINLNLDLYVAAVQRIRGEMRRRVERLHTAEATFAAQCTARH